MIVDNQKFIKLRRKRLIMTMKEMKKRLGFMVLAVLMCMFCMKGSTIVANAAEKQLQGGKTLKEAKEIKSGQDYVVNVKKNRTYWYKFKAPKYSSYFKYYTKNINKSGGIKIWLNTKWAEHLKSMGASGNGGLNEGKSCNYTSGVLLDKNRWYYISISGVKQNSGEGYAKFSIHFNKDDAPNDKSHAKEIKIGKSYAKKFDGVDDDDWFKFKVTKSGKYKFYLKNQDIESAEWEGCIYSKNGNRLSRIDDLYDNDADYEIIKLKKNQWYYIKVANNYDPYDYSWEYLGTYEFSISYVK